MKRFTRRSLLRTSALLVTSLVQTTLIASCRRRRPTPTPTLQEPTKLATEAPEETLAPPTPAPSRTPYAARTPTPAPPNQVIIIADVTDYGWTHLFQRQAPTFQEMHPHITLQWRSLTPWQDYPQRIAAYHASGLLGDLVEAPFGALMAEWAANRIIQPLDGLFVDEGVSLEGLFPGALNACRFQSHLYGLPFLAHGGENLLLYKASLFGREDIPWPAADWTLDDLEEAGRVMTRSGGAISPVAQYGYAPRLDLPSAYPLLPLFGANLLSNDGSECTINTDEGLECLRWAYNRIYEDGFAPRPHEVEGGYLSMLRNGSLAMVRQSFGALWALESDQVDAVMYPQHPLTGARASCASGIAYCITQHTDAPLEVLQWLEYASSPEVGAQMLLEAQLVPGARTTSWTDPRVLDRFPICSEIAITANDAFVLPLPHNLRVVECQTVWNGAVASLLRDEVTPEGCLAAISDGIALVLQMPAA